MAFQFGTNWSVLARMSGPIQGPLLSYETFTAFFLEASFFGILLFGRSRVPPWFYLFSTAMVAFGTTLSAFWIMANNSWMQVPVGYVVENGVFVPDDWLKIVFSPVLWVRFPHMLLAAYLTGAFCVAATGAWYLLRGEFTAEAHIMLRMGLFLAAVLVPVQIFFGHLNGDYVHDYQPAKIRRDRSALARRAAGRRGVDRDPRCGSSGRNHYEIKIPVLGSLIGSMSFNSKEVGLDRLPAAGPAARAHSVFHVPHHGRLLARHAGACLARIVFELYKERIERNRLLLWATFFSFPLPFIAILTGWFTAEVGRQPWMVYGVLRTADAMTPFLTARAAMVSLIVFCAVYTLHFRLRHASTFIGCCASVRSGSLVEPAAARGSQSSDVGRRRAPLAPTRRHVTRENSHGHVLGSVLAVSILLYVLLDGFDLGVGILFGLTRSETRRRAMMSAVAPIWDGNETWLVVAGVVLWGAFPIVYATLFSAFYLPLLLMLAGLILRGVAFEFRYKTERMRWIWDAGFAGGSLVAAFIQGMTVGALVEGLPVANGQYTGGEFGWFSPFAVMCGVGLCLGYALLGACWLVRKCEGEVREDSLSPDPLSVGRTAGLSDRRLRLCSGRESSGHAPLARAAIFVRLPGDRRHGGDRACRQRSVPPRRRCRSTWSR